MRPVSHRPRSISSVTVRCHYSYRRSDLRPAAQPILVPHPLLPKRVRVKAPRLNRALKTKPRPSSARVPVALAFGVRPAPTQTGRASAAVPTPTRARSRWRTAPLPKMVNGSRRGEKGQCVLGLFRLYFSTTYISIYFCYACSMLSTKRQNATSQTISAGAYRLAPVAADRYYQPSTRQPLVLSRASAPIEISNRHWMRLEIAVTPTKHSVEVISNRHKNSVTTG
jgi:hypothetical protein